MTAVRKSRAVSPLALKMAEAGGVSVAKALEQAEAGLASHRDAAMETVRRRLERLETLVATRPPDGAEETYEVAAALLDIAGFFDTGPLHPAVSSLCDLADHMLHMGGWNWQAVTLHVTALRLMLDTGCGDDEMSRSLLQGLDKLTAHVRRAPSVPVGPVEG